MFQSFDHDQQPMPQFIIAASDDQRSESRLTEFPPSPRSHPDDAAATTWVCERLTERYN